MHKFFAIGNFLAVGSGDRYMI